MAGAETPIKVGSSVGYNPQQFQSGDYVPYNFGGTGQTSWSEGDILYASAANTLSRLSIGVAGQVLVVSGGVPAWGSGIGGYATSIQNAFTNASGSNSLAYGEPVYLSANDKISPADYTYSNYPACNVAGLVSQSGGIAASASGLVCQAGILTGITIPSMQTMTVGYPAYLGSSGGILGSAPSSTGEAVVVLGLVCNNNGTTFDLLVFPQFIVVL